MRQDLGTCRVQQFLGTAAASKDGGTKPSMPSSPPEAQPEPERASLCSSLQQLSARCAQVLACPSAAISRSFECSVEGAGDAAQAADVPSCPPLSVRLPAWAQPAEGGGATGGLALAQRRQLR